MILVSLLENVVYNHLLYLGYEVKVVVWDAQEIDFVAERAGELLYVQVASKLDAEATIEREFGNLLKIQDNYPKLVITIIILMVIPSQGIKHMHIRDFLVLQNLPKN